MRAYLKLKAKTGVTRLSKSKAYVAGYEKAKAAAENLAEILKLITESADVPITVEPAFARGLEYYTGMIFEIYIPELEIALGGGGRYDKLMKPSAANQHQQSAAHMESTELPLHCKTQKAALAAKAEKRVAVLPITEALKSEALKIAQQLRSAGVPVEFEVMGRKMAKALEDADKRKVDFAVIVGERELKEGTVVLKDLVNRQQSTVANRKFG